MCQCRAEIYDVLKWTVDGWEKDRDHCYMKSFVIAWQPLPEPYKEQKLQIQKARRTVDEDEVIQKIRNIVDEFLEELEDDVLEDVKGN